jgi:four helix bundle protein
LTLATITRFEEIEAWRTARQLANLVYDLSEQGQFARDFGLKDQMRRAAVSAMSNIAEGFESRTQAMFLDFESLSTARRVREGHVEYNLPTF